MLTRPNEIDPFQSALPTCLFLQSQFAFGLEPVFEIHSMAAAALQIAMVRALANVLFSHLRFGRSNRRIGEGLGAIVGRVGRRRGSRLLRCACRCSFCHTAISVAISVAKTPR